MADSTNDLHHSFEDSLKRLVMELDAILAGRETSTPGEWVVPDSIRESALYSAVQSVERHLPGEKLPVKQWRSWIGMLRITSEKQTQADAADDYENFYDLCDDLKTWAVGELDAPCELVGPFTEKRWSGLLRCCVKTVRKKRKAPISEKGQIYLYRKDLPPDIDQRIAKGK